MQLTIVYSKISKLWYMDMGSVDKNILLSITSQRNQKLTIPSVKTLGFFLFSAC